MARFSRSVIDPSSYNSRHRPNPPLNRSQSSCNAWSTQNPCLVAQRISAITDCLAKEKSWSRSVMDISAVPSLKLIIEAGNFHQIRWPGSPATCKLLIVQPLAAAGENDSAGHRTWRLNGPAGMFAERPPGVVGARPGRRTCAETPGTTQCPSTFLRSAGSRCIRSMTLLYCGMVRPADFTALTIFICAN